MKTTKRKFPKKVKCVRFRKSYRTGPKETSPGSFVLIDVEREERDARERAQYTVQNQVDFSDEQVNQLEQDIGDTSTAIRDALLNLLSNIAGYDKATGEVEAIARDFIETEVEHDTSVQAIAQTVAQMDVASLFIKNALNIPEAIKEEMMRNCANVFANSMPTSIAAAQKLERHRHFFDNMVAAQKRAGREPGPYITPTIGVRSNAFESKEPRFHNG